MRLPHSRRSTAIFCLGHNRNHASPFRIDSQTLAEMAGTRTEKRASTKPSTRPCCRLAELPSRRTLPTGIQEIGVASCIRLSRRTSTSRRACRSSYGPSQLCPSVLWRWCLPVRRGGRLGWFRDWGGCRGCPEGPAGFFARAAPQRPGREHPRHRACRCAAPGALLEPSQGRATPPAVASQVAGRVGRDGLPRPPSLPGPRLHL